MLINFCILFIILIILIVITFIIYQSTKYNEARADLDGRNNINGYVHFKQRSDHVEININVMGLSDGDHGFHVHEKADISGDCMGACAHYNPTNVNHGDLKSGHAGDLGNLTSKDKICKTIIRTNKFRLSDVIGRSIIIHADPDDLGLGGNAESLKTGNSGARIACAIIQKLCNYF